jgi:Zn-dependent peptidase ImmA (M78 family)
VTAVRLSAPTTADIDAQVAKVLRGLGSPEPPLDLDVVRELLKLDRDYYSSDDDGLLREAVSRLKVAGLQVLKRPTLLKEAIRSWNLKALYLPDQKRILIDQALPALKHRWNEAHEIGHDIVPWHAGMMLGDTEQTLTIGCRAQIEAEANFAAGRMLFLGDRFAEEANASPATFENARLLAKRYGNTITSTLWRYVEQAHATIPMVALVSGHPHPSKWKDDFDPGAPCRHCIESPSYLKQFGIALPVQMFQAMSAYCGSQRGGELGTDETILIDLNAEAHVFRFETFFNGHDALTLATWLRPRARWPTFGRSTNR